MSELFLKVVNMSISASWLVLAILLIRLVLKKSPKWVRVLLWSFVAIRLICPFSIESMFSLIPSAETISPEIMMDWTPEISTGIGSVDAVINPIITQRFAPNLGDSMNPLQLLIPLAAVAWIVGIAAMLIYAVASYILLQRRVGTAVRLRDNIFQGENVDSPFVLGIIKPKIYLPFRMDGQNLEYVVSHENAHIHRKDHWWKPLGFVLLAIHWFNPLMWFSYILLCRDIELACDEKVIKEMDNETKANYTQALVVCSVNRRSIAACPLAFGEVGVKERVKSVMNYKKPTLWIIIAAVVICAVVAVCFLTNPNTSVNKKPSGATGEIIDSNGNIVKKPLNGDIIIKDNNSGEIIYDGTQKDSLFSTAIYVVNNKTGEIIYLEKSPMTAAQLISSFVNGGKEILDCPVKQNVYIAKNDAQQTATIHSIVVKAATVTFRYTYDADAVQEPGEFRGVKVVLTNGTVINMLLGPYGAPGDNGEFVSTYVSTKAIPAEDIDYIQIGETIVAITQITAQGNPTIPSL